MSTSVFSMFIAWKLLNPGPTCQTLVIILGRNVGWLCIEICDIVADFSIGTVLERTCIITLVMIALQMFLFVFSMLTGWIVSNPGLTGQSLVIIRGRNTGCFWIETCGFVAVLTIGIVSKGHDSTSWLWMDYQCSVLFSSMLIGRMVSNPGLTGQKSSHYSGPEYCCKETCDIVAVLGIGTVFQGHAPSPPLVMNAQLLCRSVYSLLIGWKVVSHSAGIAQSLAGAGNSGLNVGATSLITGAHSDISELQRTMPGPSESLALSGMGLPTSPVSISSTTLNSMVHQQGNSPLSRLEQQVCKCLCSSSQFTENDQGLQF